MRQMKAGISVPLVGNDRVIGFLNLWDERVPEAYASDEIALILEIAEQLATVVENSKLYEQDARAGPPRRAGRDGRGPRARDPQSARARSRARRSAWIPSGCPAKTASSSR